MRRERCNILILGMEWQRRERWREAMHLTWERWWAAENYSEVRWRDVVVCEGREREGREEKWEKEEELMNGWRGDSMEGIGVVGIFQLSSVLKWRNNENLPFVSQRPFSHLQESSNFNAAPQSLSLTAPYAHPLPYPLTSHRHLSLP